MMKIIFYAFFVTAPAAAFAAHSNVHIFFCDVVSFDLREVKAKCDSSRPKLVVKIPRAWIDEGGQKLRMNKQINIPMDAKRLAEWNEMNK